MKISFNLQVLVFVIFISCTYSPEGTYFEELAKKTPEASIVLNDIADQDTIYIYKSSSFQYDIYIKDVVIKEVKITIGSLTLSTTQNPRGTFLITDNLVQSGTYDLKIAVTSNSGTGSLFDKLGKEEVTIWHSWILIVDVLPPPKPELQTSSENGFLKISWTPYLKKNFVNYTLYIGQNGSEKIVTITDSKNNFYVDSTKLWNSNEYVVSTQTFNHTIFSERLFEYEDFRPTFKYKAIDSTATITWNKVRYPGAFKQVIITENDIQRSIVTQPNDTIEIIKLNPVLGKNTVVSVAIYKRFWIYNDLYSQYKYNVDNPINAKKTFANQEYYYSMSLGSVMATSSSLLLRTFNSEMKVIDSLNLYGRFSIPSPGKHIYLYSGSMVTQLNLITKEVKLFSPIGKSGFPIEPINLSASDNGYISYSGVDFRGPNSPRYISAILDTNIGQTIKMFDTSYTFGASPDEHFFLSDDGQFARQRQQIFDLRNGAFSSIGFLSNSNYDFRSDESNQLIYKGTPTEILKTNDLTLLKTLPQLVPGFYLKNYDPVTKNLFYISSNSTKVYLINIETSIVTMADCFCSHFYNGTLFTKSGYYLKIM